MLSRLRGLGFGVLGFEVWGLGSPDLGFEGVLGLSEGVSGDVWGLEGWNGNGKALTFA